MMKLLNRSIAFLMGLIVLCYPAQSLSQSDFSKKVRELSDKLVFTHAGSILSIDKDMLYIDLGHQDDIITGNRFMVVRLGEPLILENQALGKKILGYQETIIGELEVERVRKNYSVARLISAQEDIEKGDKIFQQKKKIARLAITEFSCRTGTNTFTKNVRDMLRINLTQKGVQIAEIEKSGKILKNNQLTLTGQINPETAKKIGDLLDVDGVITGDIVDLENYVNIRATLVDVTQGRAIATATTAIAKTPIIAKLLENKTKTKKPLLETIVLLFGKSEKKKNYFETDDLCLSVKSFKKSQDNIYITLFYENLANKNIAVKMGAVDNIYLIDENRNKWAFISDTAGIQRWGRGIMRNSKIITKVSFSPSDSTSGTVFTLMLPHSKPDKFEAVIDDLIPE